MKKVVVFVNLYGSNGRRLLDGILSFLESGRRGWGIRIVTTEDDLEREIDEAGESTGADGFILGTPLAERLRGKALSLDVPVVLMNMSPTPSSRQKGNVAFACTDNASVGVMAARYLRSLGSFRSYAYVGSTTPTEWSAQRCMAFAGELVAKGAKYVNYESGPLSSFLKTLDLPAAVFASHDIRAIDVIDSARKAGIGIPSQMVVLGVDDDNMICLTTRPTLSSVRCNDESIGSHAAKMINGLLSGKPPLSKRIFLALPHDVVERDSSRSPAPASAMLARALSYISEHATDGIVPSDVARYLKVSRRLLDMRFHELENTTVAQAITDRKLEVFKRMSKVSKMPTSKLARQCGFKNANALRNLFRKRFGMTIGEYRR